MALFAGDLIATGAAGALTMLLAAITPAAAAGPILPPVIDAIWAKWLVIALAYIVTVGGSSDVVRAFLSRLDTRDVEPGRSETPAATAPISNGAGAADHERRLERKLAVDRGTLDTGMVIGKCENIITVTLILLGQETGLALIFGAKSIVRREDIQKNPRYYLGGTMINFVWGMMVAFAAKALIFGLG